MFLESWLAVRRSSTINLQRRVRQLAHESGVSVVTLVGMRLSSSSAQRADVLVHGAMLGHDEDVLVLQRRRGRQRIGNAKWACVLLFHGSQGLVDVGDEVGGVLDAARTGG